jgi:Protein of unknown function (DUF3300)
VQRLRVKAKESGNLKSTKEQTVKTQPAPAAAPAATGTSGTASTPAPQIIIIESSSPEVVYVPTYNPTVVYGAWPYPAYPPYYYYPPTYPPGAAFWSFSAGVIVGGAIWGNCNWGGSDIDIDVNRYNNFNRNEINHNRNTNVNNRSGNKSTWQHNSEHRKGVEYRDSATQQKYGRGASQQGTKSREQFRGHADQGRQQLSREGAANQRDLSGNQIGTRDTGSNSQYRDLGSQESRDRAAAQTRDASTAQRRDSSAQRADRSSSASRSSDAFRDVGNGASARASSSRGGASRGGGGRRR